MLTHHGFHALLNAINLVRGKGKGDGAQLGRACIPLAASRYTNRCLISQPTSQPTCQQLSAASEASLRQEVVSTMSDPYSNPYSKRKLPWP